MSFSTRPRAPHDRSARWESSPASLSPGAAASVVIVLARALHARARDWLGGSSGVAAAPRPCPVTSPALDTPELTELVYELLDAHADTAELVADHALEDERWCAHLEYLQALQRHGRGLLARACVDEAA